MSSSDALGGSNGSDGPGSSGGPGGSGGSVGPVSSSSNINTHTVTGAGAVKITNVQTPISIDPGGVPVSVSTGSGTSLNSGISTTAAIKIATGGTVTTAIGTPIALNPNQSSTATAIRAIGASGQSTQVRVVMPTGIMPPTMIKQIDSTSAGRTQITAIPAVNARTVSNTAITVTRPATQTTYLPRAGVTATQMTGVGVATGQRLVSPLRATPVAAGVNGLTAAASFVRGTAVTKNPTTPCSTVITSGTSTWIAANNSTGQVQLIRAIPQPNRQRIITSQGISNAGNNAVAVSGAANPTTISTQGGQSTIQAVSSPGASHNPQQTYVATLATVIPSRQHQATLVYSSNVASTSQPQPFNPSVATGQRFAVATSLNAAAGTSPRQIRPIPLGKSFSATKLNTTSISIRAPNIPQLATTVVTGVSGTSTGPTASIANSPRSTTVTGVTGSTGSVLPTPNLSTTRIIQLQQQPGATAQQIIGSAGRLAGNVMLQPIIVNTTGAGKFGLRPPVTMATKVQPSLTITQLDIGKLPASASTVTGPVSSSGTPTVIATPTVSVSGANVSLTSQNMAASSGGATVLPLAISTRGGATGNILTGTITPIKNANCITVGKVMPQSQVAAATADGGPHAPNAAGSGGNATANVYIHHTSSPQISHAATAVGNANAATSTAPPPNTVLTSTGNSTSTAFLPPGSTIYYESVPASSVQVSSGVLSLTTTTVTSSTITQNQNSSSTSNLAISSLPLASHTANSTATFTVMPSSSTRTFGQLHIPVPSTGTQIQAVPVRLSAQLTTGNVNSAVTDPIAVSQAAQQLVQGTVCSTGQQVLIPAHHQNAGTLNAPQGQHMVIPLQTPIKVTTGGNTGSAVFSNFLRKRDADGIAIRAAKNLGPTLLSMGSSNSMESSTTATSIGSVALTAEALTNADRNKHNDRPDSPASSDGSTTVSANSSPGVEQQIQDGNLVLSCMPGTSDSTHFNPIIEMYSNHHSIAMQHHLPGTSSASHNCNLEQQRMNGICVGDNLPRKKLRRLTGDSQQSQNSSLGLLPTPADTIDNPGTSYDGAASVTNGAPITFMSADGTKNKSKNVPQTAGNKENAKPTEYLLRRPRQCTLLNSYKQSWKATNNHFQRSTDVKPREERRPNVVDIANQANMMGKVNGWKIHHLSTQMKDLCRDETQIYDKLSKMLKNLEMQEKANNSAKSETERITDLLKGNIQRSKIIVDGISDAQVQIMKIFEHKSYVTDIIQRCASKRNFKKREKL